MKLFIPLVGQFTNVGDVMHRKQLLSWFEGKGQKFVYVGKAPDSFVSSLKFDFQTKIYTSFFKWLLKLLFSLNKSTCFIFNPGEINLRAKRLLGEFVLFPFSILIRLFGGKVLRIGIAAKTNKTKIKILWKFVLNISNKVYWRTKTSYEYFQMGKVIPDLAFAYTEVTPGMMKDFDKRNYLTISMRFDRPEPTDKWYNAIKQVAQDNNLTIWVVSQVRMDNQRTEFIADKLKAKVMIWPEELTHYEQELKVREIYSNTKLLISDRLHVLIAGATELANPAVVLTSKTSKVEEHFSVINYPDITMFEQQNSYEQLVEFLEKQLKRNQELYSKIVDAQKELNQVKSEVYKLLKINGNA